MKPLLPLLLLLAFFGEIAAQPEFEKNGFYIWKVSVPMQPSYITGKSRENMEPVLSKTGQKFRVVHIKNNLAVLRILDYTRSIKVADKENNLAFKIMPGFFVFNYFGDNSKFNSISKNKVNARRYEEDQAYFTVPAETISNDKLVLVDEISKASLTAGVINFPFKFRTQKGKGDFNGSFNFGAAIGLKFKHKTWRKFEYALVSGYSISNILLDSSNTNANQGKLASSNNYTAFSFSLGFLVQYEKVQAGIFIGWDRLNRLNHREFKWDYQGKPWFSVGFGFAIFSEQKATAPSSVEQ